MRILGDIQIGEGSRWASKACEPLNGKSVLNTLFGLGLGVAPVIVAMIVASLVTDTFGAPAWLYLPILIGTILLLLPPMLRLFRAMFVRRFRRNLIARGVVDPLAWEMSVDADGLRTRLGEVETRAPWSVISEIFPVGPYWVLLVQGSAHFVPRRNFADPAHERTFVATVLERLTPEARGRSARAARFAGA